MTHINATKKSFERLSGVGINNGGWESIPRSDDAGSKQVAPDDIFN